MDRFTNRAEFRALFLIVVLPLGAASAHHRRASTYDDTSAAVVYSQGQNGDGVNGWGAGSDSGDFGGGEHYSNAYAGSFVVHFIGTDFQWIGKKGPNFGIASLFMDGQPVGTVDAYNSTVLHQQVLYSASGLANTAHAFQMKIGDYPNPAKNPASTNWYQVMDSFTTSGTPVNSPMVSPQNGAVTRAGNWSFGPNVLSGAYCWSNDRSTPASLTFPFSGTGVEVYGHPEGEDGKMDVYIDGSYVTTVDEYNPLPDSVISDATNDTLIYVKAGLPAGNHTIKVVVAQTKNPSATDYYTQIDGFVVLPSGGGGGGTGGALSGSSGPSSGFNLTTTGTADWAHWGRGGAYGTFDHKSSGGGQISNVALVGAGGNYGGWSDASRSVSWSDGTPTGSAANEHGYIWSNGALGTGFQLTVPADTSSRTVVVYFGASTATCSLSAHLSDSSASDYSTTLTGPGAWSASITYHAASSGQSLVLKLLKTGNNPGTTNGSADLDAAMLQGGGGGGGPVGNGTGLTGQYFDNIDFTSLKVTRTDSTVNFDWGAGSPDPSVGADTFSVRWTGQVQAQFSETYTFFTVSDDGVRLWVNGQLVVNNWTDHPPTENSGAMALAAGQKYDLRMEFYENGGGATAKLLWSSPSTAKQAVPQSQLYPASPGGGGAGLTGQYFDNIDFTNLKVTRTDATVNFDWGSGSPDPSMGPDTFSVRWTGQVQVQFSESYTFYTTSDDGIRLWVNGVLVINNWTDHAPTENSGAISLGAGQKYSVKLEFYENGGGAVAKLLWSSPSTPKQVIPQAQLYPQ